MKKFYGSHKEAKKHLENISKIVEENPVCYLTGEYIDLKDPKSYSIDHIVPISKGGINDISNLGLSTRWANLCKSGLTYEEFLDLCKKVLKKSNEK